MALPPPWLAIHAALEATLHGPEYQVVSAKQRAQDIVEHFEAMGWRLVPSYAVDESKIGVGLKFDDAPAKTSMTVEEFDAQMNKDRDEWCPECETSPGGCPPGTCPGRIEPQIKESE